MDRESEEMLKAILEQYNGNEKNYVDFMIDNLPEYLKSSFYLECEKLQMYGVVSGVNHYTTGTAIKLSESGKKYFSDKEEAYKREEQKVKEMETLKKPFHIHKKYDVFISHASRDKST